MNHLAANTIQITTQSVRAPYHEAKVFWDRLLACVLLIPAAPVIAVLCAAVRITSRGPAIYKQARMGKDGRPFYVYKLRSMYQNAEAVTGPTWATARDSRITPLGRVLRFLHLDELPQLVNVVRNEMSLVGPRPERPEFLNTLVKEVPDYHDRHSVLPGITGLAQINLPPDESIDSVRRKTIVDRYYVEHACLGLDARILICTALRLVGVRHGRAPRWLGVEFDFANYEGSLNGPTADADPSLRETIADSPKSPRESPSQLRRRAEHRAHAYALASVTTEDRSSLSDEPTGPRRRPK